MKKTLAILFTTSLFMSSCSKEIDTFEPKPDGYDISLLEYGDGIYDLAGHGTDATIEYATRKSSRALVIDINRLATEYPNEVRYLTFGPEETSDIRYSEHALDYSQKETSSQTSTSGFALFKEGISSSFSNTISSSQTFNGKYIYASHDVLIATKEVRILPDNNALANYVTPEFLHHVNNSTPAYLVERFGTHVMKNIVIGGRLKLMYQAETINEERTEASEIGMKWAMGNIRGVNNESSVDMSKKSMNHNEALFVKSIGGDQLVSFTGGISTPPVIDIDPWKQSINQTNSVIIDFASPNSLIPIYEFITDPAKKAQVKSYVEQYLEANKTKTEDIPVNLYRYWNSGYMDHYYTINQGNYGGYVPEGVECKVYNYNAPGTVAIYGYFKRGTKPDHYYTKAPSANPDWEPEGIQFFAYPSQVAGSIPIYVYWNPSYIDHFYSRYRFNPGGYIYEGIEWYAFPPNPSDASPQFSPIY